MDLYLHHGRATPDQKLDDWGPSGPRLLGVKGIHQTYGNPANVFFESAAACKEAQRLTGWATWDDNALTMAWRDDCVHVTGPEGEAFYGDWGLM
jgi:hypothetical protein